MKIGYLLFGLFLLALAVVIPATVSWELGYRTLFGLFFGVLSVFVLTIALRWDQLMELVDDYISKQLPKADDDFVGCNPMAKTVDSDDLRD